MEDKDRRLIDEALSDEAIKNTFRLSWEFVTLNKNFTLTAMSMLLLLNILSAFLGFLAMVVSGIFSMAIQIYISRVIYESKSIDEFVQKASESKLETILPKYAPTASGAYFGTLFLLFGVVLFMVFAIKNMGVDLENMKLPELIEIAQVFSLPLILTILLLSYIYPLVQSNIALSESFKEGYRAMFTLFLPSLWKRSFRRQYFTYVALMTLIVGSGAFLLGLFISLPFVNILASFILIIAMYLYMVLSAISSMMARRLVED